MLIAASVLAAPCALAQTISATSDLAFGRFAANAGGAITITPAGIRSRTGAVVLLSSTVSAATFRVPIRKDKQMIITVPANGTSSLSNGTASMPLINFVSSKPGDGVLAPTERSIAIGATLQVAPQQPPGNYTGAIHIIVEYQ